ncbi:MAG: S8 family serine peptidase [Ilumatobacteraceae bacterium]
MERGITFINAAGNDGYAQYWRGPWRDDDRDGWLEFAPGDERLDVDVSGTGGYLDILGFRWSDWGAPQTRTDYDVFIYEGDELAYPVDGTPDQRAGANPIELAGVSGTGANINIRVKLRAVGGGTVDDVLELLTYAGDLEYWQAAGSATNGIVDSANRGVLAVGAIDPVGSESIADYSSRGPTNDGRIKPDVAADSGLSTSVYGSAGFRGTSAAAPVVTGIAALFLDAGLAASPQGLAALVKNTTTSFGPPGPDNDSGWGRAIAGPPPTTFGALDATASRFTAVAPQRIFDSRTWNVDANLPESIVRFDVGSDVPTDATAVALNVTVAAAATESYVQVFPTGLAPVDAFSSLNLSRSGQDRANFVISPLDSTTGHPTLSAYLPSGGHLIVDLLGYFSPTTATRAGRLAPLTPIRVLDTRQSSATAPTSCRPAGPHRPAAGDSLDVVVPPSTGIDPSTSSAVVVTVTATDAAAPGYVTTGVGGAPVAETSTLNLSTGETVANTAIVPLAANGTIRLFTSGGAHLIVDVAGSITSATAPSSTSGRFVPITPNRVSDSRATVPFRAGEQRAVAAGGQATIPTSGVAALSANLTAIQPGEPAGSCRSGRAASRPSRPTPTSTGRWRVRRSPPVACCRARTPERSRSGRRLPFTSPST